jgi:hypothetical protein
MVALHTLVDHDAPLTRLRACRGTSQVIQLLTTLWQEYGYRFKVELTNDDLTAILTDDVLAPMLEWPEDFGYTMNHVTASPGDAVRSAALRVAKFKNGLTAGGEMMGAVAVGAEVPQPPCMPVYVSSGFTLINRCPC